MDEHMDEIDLTPQQVARLNDALTGAPGICRALDPTGTFICCLDTAHEGDHDGFELPRVTIDDPLYWLEQETDRG